VHSSMGDLTWQGQELWLMAPAVPSLSLHLPSVPSLGLLGPCRPPPAPPPPVYLKEAMAAWSASTRPCTSSRDCCSCCSACAAAVTSASRCDTPCSCGGATIRKG
jgi:hypothetical protein